MGECDRRTMWNWRPLATVAAIVGVQVTNAGSDAGQDAAMRDQVEERADEAVEEQLMDGDFLTLEGIERAAVDEVALLRAGAQVAETGGESLRPQADGQ